MYPMLFKSRWIAIAFAVLTIISVVTFVGPEGEDSTLGTIKRQVEAQRDAVGEMESGNAPEKRDIRIIEPQSRADNGAVALGFASDDELIDDAEGFDPTPSIDSDRSYHPEAQPVAPDGTTYIVVGDGRPEY